MGNGIKLAAAPLCILAAGFSVLSAAVPDRPQPDVARHKGSIEKYCVTCHNERLKTGGLVLAGLDSSNASANADRLGKSRAEIADECHASARYAATRSRPPAEPDCVFRKSARSRRRGRIPIRADPCLHRLNRAEYANAIRDLLALDIDAASLLPPDDAAYGFDNISDALGLSPALQEHYLSAALKIGALAVGDPHVAPGSETYRIRQDLSQNQHIEGMPLGTIGGTRVRYNFPLDGEYILQAKLFRTNLNIMRGLSTVHQVEFAIDGQRVRLATFGGPQDLAALFEKPTDTGDAVDARLRVAIPVKAGPHEVTVAFVEGPMVEAPDRLQPYIRSSVDNFDWAGLPHIQTFAITGPFDVTGPGDTPSRRRIFICHPANTSR